MAGPSVVTAQTDFSAGEVDVALKRANDHPLLKAAARQMSNWRILSSRSVKNRPGRKALFSDGPRVEELQPSPGNTFYLVFGNTCLRVYNAAGTKVFDSGNVMPWTTATAHSVVRASYKLSYYLTFTGMQPRVLNWDGVSQTSTWTLQNYVVDLVVTSATPTTAVVNSATGIGATPYVTVVAGAVVGFGFVSTGDHYAVGDPIIISGSGAGAAANVNSVFVTDFLGHGIITGTVVTAGGAGYSLALNQILSVFYRVAPKGLTLTPSATTGAITLTASTGYFVAGMVGTIFRINNKQVIITAVASPLSASASVQETLTGTTATVVWDEDVFNAFRGYPESCFVDQGRLGFCNFPAVPGLVVWSRFGTFTDLYTGANPTDPMAEILPGNSQALYVLAGMEGSEFVFCNNAIYYIPITITNPLKPGGVSFNQITADGCAAVEPRECQQSIVYVSSGSFQIKAVQAVGAYSRPYIVEDLSELHVHLINSPVAIAIPTSGSSFEERYIYVLNSDGTLMVGKYELKNGVINREIIGWLPWSGGATVTYVAAQAGEVVFSSRYAPNGIGAVMLAEVLDDTRYLDASQLYNTQPTGLPIPGGKGPLWWLPGGTVDLMDGPLGTRMMGTYTVNANGFLVPQFNAGEDFTSVNLVVGQAWTATLEPFIPAVQAGQDVAQRMWPRRLLRVQAYVQDSTGFLMARLYSGESGPNLPAAGTVMKRRRIATWNVDEDPTQPPPLREQSYLDRPLGRSHDPRWSLVKDTPGPITVLELSTEVSV